MLSPSVIQERSVYDLATVSSYLKTYFNEIPKTKNILIKATVIDARNPDYLNRKSNFYYFQLVQDKYNLGCLVSYSHISVIRDIYEGNGKEFILLGSLSYYDKANNVSFFVEDCIEVGKSKKELEQEKIFKLIAQNNWYSKRRKIPAICKTVGVVTASGHAAEKDIYTIIKKNNPLCEIIFYHTLVQGQNAPQDIADKINEANREQKCDVLIIGRGGGGSQDLDAFNSLLVVEAVAKSKIITISAVGHATDVVIIDQVADHSAKTPSDAAAMVAISLIDYLANKLQLLNQEMKSGIELALYSFTKNYHHKYQELLSFSPFKKILTISKEQATLTQTLHFLMTSRIQSALKNYYSCAKSLSFPIQLFTTKKYQLETFTSSLVTNMSNFIFGLETRRDNITKQLIANSPKRILELGYAKLQNALAEDVTSIKDLKVNDSYKLILADGNAQVVVTSINKGEKNE